jgi:hypothetical protein
VVEISIGLTSRIDPLTNHHGTPATLSFSLFWLVRYERLDKLVQLGVIQLIGNSQFFTQPLHD